MEAIAKGKFQRIAVRKARVILNVVRGKNAADALNQLKFTKKAAAPMVAKLIDSAIANAQQKDDKVDLDNLYVKACWADKAPDRYMRRWRPRAMGRATRITKGMSHITIVLGERGEA
jgi:large subunit ribosomal protein L22